MDATPSLLPEEEAPLPVEPRPKKFRRIGSSSARTADMGVMGAFQFLKAEAFPMERFESQPSNEEAESEDDKAGPGTDSKLLSLRFLSFEKESRRMSPDMARRAHKRGCCALTSD